MWFTLALSTLVGGTTISRKTPITPPGKLWTEELEVEVADSSATVHPHGHLTLDVASSKSASSLADMEQMAASMTTMGDFKNAFTQMVLAEANVDANDEAPAFGMLRSRIADELDRLHHSAIAEAKSLIQTGVHAMTGQGMRDTFSITIAFIPDDSESANEQKLTGFSVGDADMPWFSSVGPQTATGGQTQYWEVTMGGDTTDPRFSDWFDMRQIWTAGANNIAGCHGVMLLTLLPQYILYAVFWWQQQGRYLGDNPVGLTADDFFTAVNAGKATIRNPGNQHGTQPNQLTHNMYQRADYAVSTDLLTYNYWAGGNNLS